MICNLSFLFCNKLDIFMNITLNFKIVKPNFEREREKDYIHN